MEIKVIVTGTTGMVGEGVMMECLEHPNVSQVLCIGRRPNGWQHPKLKELIVADLAKLAATIEELKGYDACFFCAGVSSVGMNEADYTRLTYDTTLSFAKSLAAYNPNLVFTYVSGAGTDGSEKGKVMWGRVKGKTENALAQVFKKAYAFRPGAMKPTRGQKNIKPLYKVIGILFPLFQLLFPSQVCSLKTVGRAMINCVLKGYPKQVLEIKDIQLLGGDAAKSK